MQSKSAHKNKYPQFHERQRYKNAVLLTVVIIAELILAFFILKEVLLDNLWGSKKFESWLLIIATLLIPTPLLLSFYFIKFDTIINEEGIFYRWFPFSKNYQMILWSNIEEVFIIDMKNMGFKWRMKRTYDEAHFPGSEHALLIQMKSGKKKLLGTRKAIEMNRVLMRSSGKRYNSIFVEKFDFD